MRTIALGFASCLVLLGACGPGTEPGDGSGGGTAGDSSNSTDAGTTGPGATGVAESTATGGDALLPAGCSCREPLEQAPTCEEQSRSQCTGDLLCPDVIGSCARPSADLYACEGELTYGEEALACALAALRDRPPGKLAFDVENDTCGLEGCGSDRTEITIVPDDRAVVRHCVQSPISAESSSSTYDTLAEPAYFDECLSLTTVRERYECMVAGITRGPAVCE